MNDASPTYDEGLAYLHDGSMEGFLTAVFTAYERKEWPGQVGAQEGFQQQIGQVCVPIATDPDKAQRVQKSLVLKLGMRHFNTIFYAFLSPDDQKDTKLFRYIVHGLTYGKKSLGDITHGDVEPVEALSKSVGLERHYMLMFVRFSEMQNGVYFSKIEPKSNVVPVIMDHFASRLNIQPFVIYDENHHLAGVYNGKEWYLSEVENLEKMQFTGAEDEFRYLWKAFFDSIAIEERKNYALQRNHMPKRFWKNLTEVNTLDRELRRDAAQKDHASGSLLQAEEGSKGLRESGDRDKRWISDKTSSKPALPS